LLFEHPGNLFAAAFPRHLDQVAIVQPVQLGVRARIEQQTHGVGVPFAHREMHGRCVPICRSREARIALEQPPQRLDIAGGCGDDGVPCVPAVRGIEVDGLDHPAPPAGAIDERLQLGPAVESVRARQHQLRVVQREGRRFGDAIVGRHLGDRGRITGPKRVEQLFRLAFELIEMGTRRKRASGGGHDELLSWPRVRACRRPVSARSGRKEFIDMNCATVSGGLSPFRGHGGALLRCAAEDTLLR
jgi:hypothetical protein